jgi:acyl carrier protein
MSSDFEDVKRWTAESVANKVREIVAAKACAPVSAESTFDSLGLDSLAMAEMVFEIESAFRIHADERLLDMRSIGEVIAYVVQEVKREQTPRSRTDRPTSAEIHPG